VFAVDRHKTTCYSHRPVYPVKGFPASQRCRNGRMHVRNCRGRQDLALEEALRQSQPLTATQQHSPLQDQHSSKKNPSPRHLCAGIAAAGKTEKQVDKEVFELGASEFGTRRHWHERIIRSGENAMHPLYIKRPDATLREDDIYFVDLGPVFYKIEADFGRTYVIGVLLCPNMCPITYSRVAHGACPSWCMLTCSLILQHDQNTGSRSPPRAPPFHCLLVVAERKYAVSSFLCIAQNNREGT